MARKKNKRKAASKEKRWQRKIAEHGKRTPKKRAAGSRKGKTASVALTPLKPEFMIGGNIFSPQSIRATFADNYKGMRKEYSRLRPVAQKRLMRLGSSDFARSDTYKVYKDMFKKLSELDDKQLPKALSELNRFLQSNLSTVSGQRDLMDERISTLQEYGYDINRNNFWLVMDIMEYLRAHYQGLIYDSDTQMEEAVKAVNEIINDFNARFSDKSVSELGDEIFERYKANRGEAWEVLK